MIKIFYLPDKNTCIFKNNFLNYTTILIVFIYFIFLLLICYQVKMYKEIKIDSKYDVKTYMFLRFV